MEGTEEIFDKSEIAIRKTLRLTPTEARVVVQMMDGLPKSKEWLADTAMSETASDDDLKIVICRIRRKAPQLEINLIWGHGYQMAPQGVAYLKSVLIPVPSCG